MVTKREEKSPEEEADIDRAYLQGIREAKDPGVALVKLADWLDNVRCMRFNPRAEKRAKYIRKTETMYLPLASDKSEYLPTLLKRV
jgi:(p)ppGpp synthase/HD superfamily hydrolase